MGARSQAVAGKGGILGGCSFGGPEEWEVMTSGSWSSGQTALAGREDSSLWVSGRQTLRESFLMHFPSAVD